MFHIKYLLITDQPDILKDTPDVFVATNEWKTLRKGWYFKFKANYNSYSVLFLYFNNLFTTTDQPIPKGLHVRINMQTGEREAKLLSTENEDAKKTDADVTDVLLLHEDTEEFAEVHDKEKYAYLKEALKKLKNETSDDENTNVINRLF